MLRAKRALTNHPVLIAVIGLFVFSLVASAVMASQEAANQAEKTDGEAENAATAEAGEEQKKDPGFAQKLDDAFGEWVVGPVGSVLMFDFYSGPRAKLDDKGQPVKNAEGKVVNESEGWLRTSVPLVVAWLAFGALFFTLRMLFINFRAFWHAIRLTKGDYDDPSEPGEVSHFQALASALSATVGLGNIAGVAIAVGTGGPGAVVWIIFAGLFGMTMKFTECSLGQMYRKVLPDGTVSGGPMHYLKDGLASMGLAGLGKVLALMFAFLCILASIGGGNTFQVVQAKGAMLDVIPEMKGYEWVFGLIMSSMVAIVIIGGIKRIGAAAGKIVPAMCGVYVAISMYIIIKNFGEVPAAIGQIWDGAFTTNAAFGGAIGVAVIGIKRAVFSNEAGVGSAAIAHSAAKTDEPISEGIVALLEPFIDTIVICTMTALVIVISGVAVDPDNAALIAKDKGAALTANAWGNEFEAFKYILVVAVVLFAYSTLISWSYYGERCSVHLFGQGASIVYRVIFVICAFLGALLSESNVLKFSDLMILSMAFPNILGVALLSGQVKRKLDDYWSRYKKGELEPSVKYKK